jgi:hypothetical protein
VATRFTLATGDCVRRRERLRPLLLRPPPLRPDFRVEDLRPLLLRRAEDFRRGDLRALPERPLVERFFALPRLRPEDPDRDLFLPPFERLDFLAAAMGKLRVGGFVEPNSKIRAQQSCVIQYPIEACIATARRDYPIVRVSPCRMIQRSLPSRPDARHCSRILAGGSSIGSSVSLNVPQWAAAIIRCLPRCAADS